MADTISLTELAYFAGFFDGEGCVAIYPRKYVVSLTNTDVIPLRRAQQLWGGYISTQDRSKNPIAIQDIWHWQIYGHNSRAFLEAIRSYTLIKSAQIDTYLEILNHVPSRRGMRYIGDAKEKIEVAAMQLRLLKRGLGG